MHKIIHGINAEFVVLNVSSVSVVLIGLEALTLVLKCWIYDPICNIFVSLLSFLEHMTQTRFIVLINHYHNHGHTALDMGTIHIH